MKQTERPNLEDLLLYLVCDLGGKDDQRSPITALLEI